MCQRERLYQIDLLNGSNNRITEREYCHAIKQADERAAESIADVILRRA